jgi:hypothetical protein
MKSLNFIGVIGDLNHIVEWKREIEREQQIIYIVNQRRNIG